MPVKLVFRCQFCVASPDGQTQAELERQASDAFFGMYVDAHPSRWLTWHGRGLLGPTRRACPDHRGELTAYLRHHYGTIGSHPWKMGPYPRPPQRAGTVNAATAARLGSGFAI